MGPSSRKRGADTADDPNSDDGFVASDNSDVQKGIPKTKKKRVSEQSSSAIQKGAKDGEDTYWEISKLRRVTVSEYNGKTMIGIREFYEKDGKSLPGKKGISLPLEQFSAFVELLPSIEAALVEKGQKIPRPNFEGSSASDFLTTNPKGAASGDKKNNFEATSDEESS